MDFPTFESSGVKVYLFENFPLPLKVKMGLNLGFGPGLFN